MALILNFANGHDIRLALFGCFSTGYMLVKDNSILVIRAATGNRTQNLLYTKEGPYHLATAACKPNCPSELCQTIWYWEIGTSSRTTPVREAFESSSMSR